ncbi:MAG: hypothetical protein R3A45_01560 [Bdellovibrionota bacterium]
MHVINIIKKAGLMHCFMHYCFHRWHQPFCCFASVFGGKSDMQSLAKIQASKHYQNKRFINLVTTTLNTRSAQSDSFWIGLKSFFFLRPIKTPDPLCPQKI